MTIGTMNMALQDNLFAQVQSAILAALAPPELPRRSRPCCGVGDDRARGRAAVRWRDEPEPGPLRTAWEGLRDALAELRAELGRAWGYRRASPASRATGPILAEPELRIRRHGPQTSWRRRSAPCARTAAARCGGPKGRPTRATAGDALAATRTRSGVRRPSR